jgi:aryl-alcohol dehydrogenase-like predicted oxidoreductase
VSNVTRDELSRARAVVPVVAVQNRHGLDDRRQEAALEVCRRDGLAFMPSFPPGEGRLARRDGPLGVLARARGVTPGQLALAWLLHHARSRFPFPASPVAHLEEYAAAARLGSGGPR